MFKRFFKFISAVSTAWGFLPSTLSAYISAAAWVLIMSTVGYVESVPLFWILLGIPIAAAQIMTFALAASEWRSRMSAAGKFSITGLSMGGKYHRDKDGKINAIEFAQIRITFANIASFPISFIVDEMQTSFEDNFPPNKPRLDNGSITQPFSTPVYSDHLTDMKMAGVKEQALGTAKFKIRFGHPGREKYLIAHNMRFQAVLHPNGYEIINTQEIVS